jgi:hypothetical protein
VIKTNDDAKAQKQLHKAASQGYRISLSEGGILVLEQAASPSVKREYRIIRTGDILALEKELNSTNGFCMVAETMSLTEKVQDKSRRIFVVLERKSEGASNCHYRVLKDRDHSFTHLQDDVTAAAEKGYQVKGVTDDELDTTVIMESSEEKRANSGSGDDGKCMELITVFRAALKWTSLDKRVPWCEGNCGYSARNYLGSMTLSPLI